MNTRSTPITLVTLDRYYPSLFNLSGGDRTFLLHGATNEVHCYVPPPVVGTRLLFVCSDATNPCYVKAATDKPIGDSTSQIITLDRVGMSCSLLARDGYWQFENPGNYIR